MTSREAQLRAATFGEPTRVDGPVALAESDPRWPTTDERQAATIRSALGDRVRLLEHVGSTAVPGLAAKPIIDILLSVDRSSDEPAYVPPLEAVGYVLRIRHLQDYADAKGAMVEEIIGRALADAGRSRVDIERSNG